MIANSKPTFRPSLIICVGKAGEKIREHLTPFSGKGARVANEPVSVYHLLANVDTPLRQMISLLQVITDGPDADFNKAVPVPVDQTFPNDSAVPTEPGELKAIIQSALISVQLDRRVMDIRTQGYNVPDTRTQIFIVGEGNDDQTDMRVMASILGIVREIVSDFHFDIPVFYFLNSNLSGDYSLTLQKLYNQPGLKWRSHHLANFSYLYEKIIPFPSPTFLDPEERHYATAEALLAFIATGVSTLPLLQAEMQLSQDLQDYSSHVGSVSTSMIYFPHEAVLKYGSNLLSADLMEEWRLSYENSHVSDAGGRMLRSQARNLARDMLSWMSDDQPRIAAEETLGPSLALLRRNNAKRRTPRPQDEVRRLDALTATLFRCFAEDVVVGAFRMQKARSWPELTTSYSVRAAGHFYTWESQARRAWEAAGVHLDADIREYSDELWEKDDEGFERAKIFIDELDDRLRDVSDEITKWRLEHIVMYKKDRDDFREKSLGEWNLSEDDPNIQGANLPLNPQLRPTITSQPPDPGAAMGPVIVGTGGGGLGSSPPPQGVQHLPSLEEAIALDLGRRVTYKQSLVPTFGTLGSATFLVGLALMEVLRILPVPSTWQLPANVGAFALVGLGGLLSRLFRFLDLRKARRDTLAFYRRYYAHQCERREDLQRMQLLRFIKGKVLQKRLRLDNLSALFTNVKNRAQEEANRVPEQLFDGPGGQRDILVANGERLQKNGRHTLGTVNQQLIRTRQNRPLQSWHHSLAAMKSELMVRLRLQPKSLLEMSDEEVQMHLSHFMREVVEGYLTGALVNISATLDKAEVWREIIERVSKPMYFANTGMRDPQALFVCGSQADLSKSAIYIPEHAIQVTTKSSEWLLVAAFFRGGQPTKFDANVLFPVK
jgi:hypothetical protein